MMLALNQSDEKAVTSRKCINIQNFLKQNQNKTKNTKPKNPHETALCLCCLSRIQIIKNTKVFSLGNISLIFDQMAVKLSFP